MHVVSVYRINRGPILDYETTEILLKFVSKSQLIQIESFKSDLN